MSPPAATPPADGGIRPHVPRPLLPERRQLVSVVVCAVIASVFLRPLTYNTFLEILAEVLFVALALLLAFTWAGSWQQKAVPRWVAQVLAVALAAAVAPLIVQLLTAGGDISRFLTSRRHVSGYILVTVLGAIIGTMFALGALVREREALAHSQALQFALERERLERQAADARLTLMTAQIQPHFLLNTLANVQELVESGSPRAVPLFRALTAYLRAAVPKLHNEEATLGDEERLVEAYLQLMQMRMPDRLAFHLDIDPALRTMRFPAMALLTLVENAIRHGIDPGVDGGKVEVAARWGEGSTVHLWVADTGVGMSETAGEGTGLTNLKARLRAFFGEDARLELSEQAPHGLRADLWLPKVRQ